MMKHKYGEFSSNQISSQKKEIQKSIYFLLLCVDPNTKENYININVDEAFKSLLLKLDGFNSIMFNPPELVEIISLLEEARIQYSIGSDYDFKVIRKLLLDSGNKIMQIKEV